MATSTSLQREESSRDDREGAPRPGSAFGVAGMAAFQIAETNTDTTYFETQCHRFYGKATSAD